MDRFDGFIYIFSRLTVRPPLCGRSAETERDRRPVCSLNIVLVKNSERRAGGRAVWLWGLTRSLRASGLRRRRPRGGERGGPFLFSHRRSHRDRRESLTAEDSKTSGYMLPCSIHTITCIYVLKNQRIFGGPIMCI